MNQKNRLHCWKVEKLENLGKWGSGGTPLSSVKDYYGGNIKWAIIGDLNDSIIYETKNKITQKGLENSSSKLVPKNSLLIAMYGSIGKTAITGDEIATNQAIAFLIPKKEVDVHFVQHFIHLNVSNLFHLSRGGTQKNINQEILKSFEIPLPTLPEQTLIAQEIEKQFTRLDASVKSLKSVKKKLEFYRKAVLKKAFEDLKEFDLLGNVIKTSSGGTPSRGNKNYYTGEIPWLKSGELRDKLSIEDSKEHISEDAIKNSSAKIFPEDTVLMAMYGATTGKIGILSKECSTNQAVCGMLPNENFISKFIFYYLMLRREYIIKQGKGGAQPNISQDVIKKINLPLCSKEGQFSIVQEIESKFSVIDKIEQVVNESLEKSEKLRKSILKSAFEGKLVKMEEVEK